MIGYMVWSHKYGFHGTAHLTRETCEEELREHLKWNGGKAGGSADVKEIKIVEAKPKQASHDPQARKANQWNTFFYTNYPFGRVVSCEKI